MSLAVKAKQKISNKILRSRLVCVDNYNTVCLLDDFCTVILSYASEPVLNSH